MKTAPYLEGRYTWLIMNDLNTLYSVQYAINLHQTYKFGYLWLSVFSFVDVLFLCFRRDYLKALHMDPLCLSARVNLAYNLQVGNVT